MKLITKSSLRDPLGIDTQEYFCYGSSYRITSNKRPGRLLNFLEGRLFEGAFIRSNTVSEKKCLIGKIQCYISRLRIKLCNNRKFIFQTHR